MHQQFLDIGAMRLVRRHVETKLHGADDAAVQFGRKQNGFVATRLEKLDDGCEWMLLEMPGAVAFGETREEALRAAEALVLRTLADRVEHKEVPAAKLEISFVSA